MRLTFYVSDKSGSHLVGRAFAEGCKGEIELAREESRPSRDVAMYGWGGTAHLLERANELGHAYYYIDNGYLSPGHWEGYFRVTRNALQVDERHPGCPRSFERLDQHGVELKPWRTDGDHIVVALQSREWFEFLGYAGGRDQWVEDVLRFLAHYTDRKVIVRDKTHTGHARAARNDRPLSADLEGAHALVCHSSNTAVEAVIAGVPVFCVGHGPARSIGGTRLRDIEIPLMPSDDERRNWLAWLAANQWTLDEMRTGKCWKDLNAASR